jgi:pre-rRNA-processing protein IPI3
MLTESFIAATLSANKPAQHLSSALKDVGIFLHELQPQNALRQGFKKSSIQPHALAISRTHVFAAQNGKAVINVYSRQKGTQEATVPFPEKITSISHADGLEVLVLGTEEGKLILWEVGTGRVTSTTAAHLSAIVHLCSFPQNDVIITGAEDSTVHVWSISKILSFQSSADSYSTSSTSNAPIMTFSQHREGITALAAGHSRKSTNFAVSASADRTCHIWHVETGEIIRTVLLPSVPTCICLDPADRAIYLGDKAGDVSNIDLLELGQTSQTKANSAIMPVQIEEDKKWRQASASSAVHAIAISYDGTTLLTGHDDGSILRWDVAKHKVANEVTKLGQPVTNIRMLRPNGLPDSSQPAFIIPEVVKPKLEFNAQLEQGSSDIPSTYKLHANLTGSAAGSDRTPDAVLSAIISDGWDDDLLDDAVSAVETGSQTSRVNGIASAGSSDRLAQENAELRRTVADYQKADLERMEKSIERMRKREDIDLKRREVYHAAMKSGQDRKAANAAMKAFMENSRADLAKLDAQTDSEAFGEPTDISS